MRIPNPHTYTDTHTYTGACREQHSEDNNDDAASQQQQQVGPQRHLHCVQTCARHSLSQCVRVLLATCHNTHTYTYMQIKRCNNNSKLKLKPRKPSQTEPSRVSPSQFSFIKSKSKENGTEAALVPPLMPPALLLPPNPFLFCPLVLPITQKARSRSLHLCVNVSESEIK